jgi:hypothetical protein
MGSLPIKNIVYILFWGKIKVKFLLKMHSVITLNQYSCAGTPGPQFEKLLVATAFFVPFENFLGCSAISFFFSITFVERNVDGKRY